MVRRTLLVGQAREGDDSSKVAHDATMRPISKPCARLSLHHSSSVFDLVVIHPSLCFALITLVGVVPLE